MTAPINHLLCVTPPYMLEKIIQRGTPEQKKKALKSLTMSARFRGQRQVLSISASRYFL